jgi:hypothetical protein
VEISDDEIRLFRVHHRDRVGPGQGGQGTVAVAREDLRTRRHHVRIVIDN